jgi:hypothetical protein
MVLFAMKLRDKQILGDIIIIIIIISLHLYFCLFTSSELMCFLSPMLGINMIFVVSFVNARTIRSQF